MMHESDAAPRSDPKRVGELLAAGVDGNSRDEYGTTPLLAAAMYDRVEVVKVLLAAGADVNARSDNGTTALAAAQQMNYRRVVALLAAAGAR